MAKFDRPHSIDYAFSDGAGYLPQSPSPQFGRRMSWPPSNLGRLLLRAAWIQRRFVPRANTDAVAPAATARPSSPPRP